MRCPRHALLFLSIYTRDDIGNDPDSIGSISRDAIALPYLSASTKSLRGAI